MLCLSYCDYLIAQLYVSGCVALFVLWLCNIKQLVLSLSIVYHHRLCIAAWVACDDFVNVERLSVVCQWDMPIYQHCVVSDFFPVVVYYCNAWCDYLTSLWPANGSLAVYIVAPCPLVML